MKNEQNIYTTKMMISIGSPHKLIMAERGVNQSKIVPKENK